MTKSTQAAVHQDRWGRDVPPRSPESIAATQHVMDLMKPSPLMPHQKYIHLDLSDPMQHRFFMDRFGKIEGYPLGPYFPSRAELAAYLANPQIAKLPAKPMLNALSAPPAAGAYVPAVFIAVFDYDTGGGGDSQVSAGGIVSVPGGATLTDVLMEIYDGKETAGQPIATGAGTTYGQYDTVANATGTLTNAGDEATALFSGQYTDSQGAPQAFAVSQTIGPQPSLTINVTDPVHKVTAAGQPITVGLGRTPDGKPDSTDYYFNPGHPGYSELLLKVTGTATPKSPSYTFVAGQTVTGSLVLQKQSGANPGGATVVYPGTIATACTATATTVTWTFNPADFGVNPPPWTAGDVILMTLNLQVSMNGPSGSTSATIVVTGDKSSQSDPINTVFMDPLQFYWGCLAAHTQVLMADGACKAIRDIRQGDRVAGPNGRVWVVDDTKSGFETKPMLEIETAEGFAVLVTDGHPILTRTGPRVARILDVGDLVLSPQGEVAITAIRQVAYDGRVHNLVLAAEDGSLPDEATFYADGILVGDDRLQTSAEKAAVESAAREELEALARSMQGWALDIENHRRARLGLPLVLALESAK